MQAASDETTCRAGRGRRAAVPQGPPVDAPMGPPFCDQSDLSDVYRPVEVPSDEHAARSAAITKAARVFMCNSFPSNCPLGHESADSTACDVQHAADCLTACGQRGYGFVIPGTPYPARFAPVRAGVPMETAEPVLGQQLCDYRQAMSWPRRPHGSRDLPYNRPP